jgi:hypothetical protein
MKEMEKVKNLEKGRKKNMNIKERTRKRRQSGRRGRPEWRSESG